MLDMLELLVEILDVLVHGADLVETCRHETLHRHIGEVCRQQGQRRQRM